MLFLRFVLVAALMCFGCNAFAASTGPLLWEPTNHVYNAKAGDVSARFSFKVRNVAASEVVVDDVKTSCGCTVAQLPGKPWKLAPGETNHLEVLMDLRGKWGKFTKEITVLSSTAPATLTLEIDVPTNGPTNLMSPAMADRIWGQQLAGLDHQAVFKKDCVHCHLEPAFGKHGQQLYDVTCGICHEAKHRATMVPDLHALKTDIDTNYWRNWVTYGKAGTLMPGFAATLGGPLDDEQINSLVDYLRQAFPRPLKTQAAAGSANN